MGSVVRAHPESRTGLIKWMEDNFHSIDQFVATFSLSDGTTMTIYDAYSYLEALGLTEIQSDCMHVDAHDGTFIPKRRNPP